MPPADEHHACHDRQLRQDRHHTGRGLVDNAAVDLSVLARIGGVGVGREQALRRDLRQEEQERVAGPEPGELVGVDLRLAGIEACRRGGTREVVPLRSRGDHVGQQEDEQRDPQEHESAHREVRVEQRAADHQGIKQHPHEEDARHGEDPDIAELLGGGARLVAAIFDRKQPRGHKNEPDEVEVPHAPDAVELEKHRDRQERRQVEPGRWIDAVVVKEDVAHAGGPARPRERGPGCRASVGVWKTTV